MSQKVVNAQLISARLEKHWTQEQACEQVGVPNVRTWQRWEKEGVTPSPYFRQRLCAVFAKSLEELGFFLSHTIVDNQHELLNNENEHTELVTHCVVALTQQQTDLLVQLLEQGETELPYFDTSKRKALYQIFASFVGFALTPSVNIETWEQLTSSSAHSIEMTDEVFEHFCMLMSQCWELSRNQLVVAEKVLAGFLPDVMRLAPHQQQAALLATQGLRLKSILSAHRLNFQSKIMLCQQAIEYAKLADDTNALVSALTELAVAYKYAGMIDESFKTYQQALHYCQQAAPLLRTRVYAASAAALAIFGRKREADFYIHLAFDEFPQYPERDPSYVYADSGIFMIAYYSGLMYLSMERPKEAEAAFISYKQHPSGNMIPERNRVEIVNYQGRASIELHDLEKYAYYLEQGLSGAIALKSKKRFDEAIKIFQEDLPRQWSTEPAIKRIVERFGLPERSPEK